MSLIGRLTAQAFSSLVCKYHCVYIFCNFPLISPLLFDRLSLHWKVFVCPSEMSKNIEKVERMYSGKYIGNRFII